MTIHLRRPAQLRSSSFAPLFVAALCLAVTCAAACSQRASEKSTSGESTTNAADAADTANTTEDSRPAAITEADLLSSERFWPDIAALVEPWTPADGATPLKQGLRGALLRVEDDLRVRIAFGRHGNHAVPLEKTDLLSRANEIRLGKRHKLGPNFVVHFGTQFVDPEHAELGPYSTLRLRDFQRFLCVFADPRSPDFATSVEALEPLEASAGVRSLLFPLGLAAGELGAVRDALVAADWVVPFAYPGGADVQARSLLGDATGTPTVLLLSAEGRVLLRAPLDAPDLADRIRLAAGEPTDAPPAP